ncbi:unnamed protein product [Mytilus coruscus]|uniref:Uncharacterized protein n=1 Tax=Mytilus coruscus TaxID=42192 RepID=A0A6J8EBJ9_MYTCO|nr:unnamed protein product [Mytilus coruscus]
MGVNLSCLKFKRKKKYRSRNSTLNAAPREAETIPSSAIIEELVNSGIITKKKGGLKFSIHAKSESNSEEKVVRKPRHLPAIRQDITEGNQKEQYNREEKDMMVDIRRIGALAEKVPENDNKYIPISVIVAKKREEKRKQVLARREARLKSKITKIEEKLKRDDERLRNNTPEERKKSEV